jgi:hypothetical protein
MGRGKRKNRNRNKNRNASLPLLCVAVMVKNEEERITRTLSSVIDHVSHVVILDTGSEDNTVKTVIDFCNKHNKPLKLKEEPFVDFAYSRNVMLKMCYGLSEFVLLLDANDEVQNPHTMVRYLEKVRNDKEDCVFGCKFIWENDIVDGNNREYYKTGIIRNNKDDIYYEFPVHEYITSSNPGKYYSNNNLQLSDFYIYQDRKKDKDSTPRIKNDVEILKKYLDENGENERAYRFLCQSYCILGDMENLNLYSDKLVKFIASLYDKSNDVTLETKYSDNYYYGMMNRALSGSRLGHSDFHKDYMRAYNHLNIVFESADPFFEMANEYLTKGNLDLAYLYIKKCCQIVEPSNIFDTQINYDIYKKHRWSSLYTIALKMDKKEDYDIACMKLHGKVGLIPVVKKDSSEAKNVNIPVMIEEDMQQNKVINQNQTNISNTNISKPKPVIKSQEQLLEQSKDSILYLIIPYRDRQEQLQTFIPYMHKYLHFHKITFKIIVVEQSDTDLFNKGVLYNIAIKYIKEFESKGQNRNIYVCLHDVDIMPVKGTNYYKPDDNSVVHLYGYNFCLGGVLLINLDDYLKLNGLSNLYEGWGFEDNDFKRRVELNKVSIDRSYFYPRYDQNCFKEINADITEPARKMQLPQTKINHKIFEANVNNKSDGLDQINNYLDHIEIGYLDAYTKIICNVEKIMEVNNLKSVIPKSVYVLNNTNQKEIYIYDNNFYPDLGASKGHLPKHFSWKNINDDFEINVKKDDIIVYTDNYLYNALHDCTKIAWLIEPPVFKPHIYEFIKENYSKFDYVLTHNKELVELDDRILYYPHGMCWIKEEDFKIYSKINLVSIIASGKDFLIGHKLRNMFIENYNKGSSNYNIDIYGWKYKPLQYKLDGLKNYYFSIAIENSQVDNYFTEKLIDCFVTGTVPIYWGSPSLDEFFDTNGIITFNTLEELDNILENLTEDDYNSRLDSIKHNFEKAKEFVSPEDWIYNNLDILKVTGPQKHFITYGDQNYEKSKERIVGEAEQSGFFDTIKAFGPEDLSDEFREQFKSVLEQPRGAGYWIWKSHIILEELNKIDDGDFLIYLDAGCTINKHGQNRFNQYLEILNNSEYGIISFQIKHLEKVWTTKEIFERFAVNLDSDIANSEQYVGGILIIKKNKHSMYIFNKCLKVISENPLLVTDHYNGDQEPYFRDNRHDQSLLSIIRKIYGSVVIKDETYGENIFGSPFLATRLI